MLERDKSRLSDARKRLNISPLGSGALAGSTINLDRRAIAAELGFDGVTQNSMDAIADRDYIAELFFIISLCGAHLSRLSEDLILWCTAEFAFASLSDAHTTGSSLMPQKKNPDVCELTRGKTGSLVGNLMNLFVAIKGLPLTYNRDLQEDKPPLFDSVDTLQSHPRRQHRDDRRHGTPRGKLQGRRIRSHAARHRPRRLSGEKRHPVPPRPRTRRQSGRPSHRHQDPARSTRSNSHRSRLRTGCEGCFSLETALAASTNPGAPSIANVKAEIQHWHGVLA
jgi:argininosuccinate lyase